MSTDLVSLISATEECFRLQPLNLQFREALSHLYSARAQQLLAEAQIAQSDHLVEQAIDFLKKVVALERDNPGTQVIRALVKIAHLQVQRGNNAEVEQACRDMQDIIEAISSSSLIPLADNFLELRSEMEKASMLSLFHTLWLKVGHALLTHCGGEAENIKYKKPLSLLEDLFKEFTPETTPKNIGIFYEMALAYHHSGQEDRCLYWVNKALQCQDQLVTKHPLAKYGIRFFQTRSCTATNIGHLVSEPEFFVKQGALGLRDPMHGMLLASSNDIINPCAINYWRKHVNVITDNALIRRLKPIAEHLEYNTFWLKFPGNRLVYYWSGLIGVQREWERKGYGPLLSLAHEHRARGLEVLRQMGLPKDAWFVALHVRDQRRGKNGKPLAGDSTNHRNSDVESYDLAIKEIVSRGGWVIRMGDKSMPQMKPRENVIDYVFSPYKSDWMDIFLVAASKFLLGSASGVNCIPSNFGVPCLLTNMSPMDAFSLGEIDLYIPKLMRSRTTGEMLPFHLCFCQEFNHCCNNNNYELRGVDHIDNTPGELRDIVVEMFERLDGSARYSDDDEELQRTFKRIAGRREISDIGCRVGREFVRKYRKLLLNEEASTSSPLYRGMEVIRTSSERDDRPTLPSELEIEMSLGNREARQ